MNSPWKVVIGGGGFGGLRAAQNLKSDLVDVTLVDRRNYHLFQPLLYQVATGSLSAAGRAAAVANVFRMHLSGLPAWLVWAFVHLMYLVTFQNRVQVFVQWAIQ